MCALSMIGERARDGDGSNRDPAGQTISAAALAGALKGPTPPVVLDVRWSLAGPPGVEEYRRGHIPGARFVDLDGALADPAGGGRGRHPLPATERFETAMREAGVTDAAVVVYDAGGGLSAARAWWLLRYHGHPGVRLLDGGLAAWLAAGQPVTTEEPERGARRFHRSPGGDARARRGRRRPPRP